MTIDFLALFLVAAGAALGYVLCALLVIAKQADRRNSHEPPEEPPDLPCH